MIDWSEMLTNSKHKPFWLCLLNVTINNQLIRTGHSLFLLLMEGHALGKYLLQNPSKFGFHAHVSCLPIFTVVEQHWICHCSHNSSVFVCVCVNTRVHILSVCVWGVVRRVWRCVWVFSCSCMHGFGTLHVRSGTLVRVVYTRFLLGKTYK